MSAAKHSVAMESARLYAEAGTLKAEYAKLSVDELEIQLAKERIKTRLATIEHTQGTLNPGHVEFAGGDGVGWGRL